VREFLLIQPEVGKVTDDGKDYYPEDIEPPSAEEVCDEKDDSVALLRMMVLLNIFLFHLRSSAITY
jgi:hypothetical protein